MTFKEAYNKAKTMGELDKVIKKHLTLNEAKTLVKALETTDTYCEITLREKALLNTLRAMINSINGNAVVFFKSE